MPSPIIRYNSKGAKVADLQKRLLALGYNPGPVDGVFGRRTLYAVKAFQAQTVGQRGRPLVVDGIVGPLTAWALAHPKGGKPVPVTCYTAMPTAGMGGSTAGRAALRAAIRELAAGAQEEGGNNRGTWVRKYLNGLAWPSQITLVSHPARRVAAGRQSAGPASNPGRDPAQSPKGEEPGGRGRSKPAAIAQGRAAASHRTEGA